MTPKLVLSLWRERWGKTADAPHRFPDIDGKVAVWGRELASSPVWGVPHLSWLVGSLCVLLGAFVATLSLTPNSQYVFSTFILCLALLLRRYRGTFVTLVLLGLALVASSRYLFWRLTGTLEVDFSWDFIFGFVLWAAELHLCVLVGLELVTQIWPIQRTVAALPEDSSGWPTVDIFVPCQGQSYAQVVAAASAALALVWSREKTRIYLLDDAVRTDVEQLATSLHINYLGRTTEDATTDDLSHAVLHTKGQLLVVLNVDQFPEPDFLKLTVGEFLRDDRLGMLHTARHFLTPPLSPLCNDYLGTAELGGSCAILRRSALADGDAVLGASVMSHAHTGLNLDALGYRHSCVGFAAATAFLIEDPFLQRSLVWRRRCAALRDALEFYYPVARAIFYTAPAVYLLGGSHLVSVSGEDFVAYALPHLFQGLIVKARVHSPGQIRVLAYLRETFLSWFVFIYTALTLAKTELANREYRFGESPSERSRPLSWRENIPFMAGVVFLFGVSAFGGVRLWEGSVREQDALTLCLLWNCHHLFTLLAAFAVDQEMRYIALHQKLMLRVPVAVKLASGRSIRCVTQNFPQTTLALQLPTGTVVDSEEVERISLFLGGREFVFPVRVDSFASGVLHVQLRDDRVGEFATLLKISRSRGEDWPQFLPGENADRPFPPWLSGPIVRMFSRVRDFLADLVINWSKKK